MDQVISPSVTTKQRKCLIKGSEINKKFFLETETTHVLKDVNFSIPEGSFTIIYGPSGSGKSTLLNCLVGLEPPTTGNINIDGQDLYSLNPDQRANFRARTLGMVYQTNYWVNSLSVLDNVSMPLFLSGYNRTHANSIAEEALVRVGMADFKTKRPTVLSGGQQQRVSMARALVANPTWVVADEPTGNLDTKNGDLIMNLLYELKQKMGKTVVLVTHNMEYLTLSDHRLRIKDGVLVEDEGAYGLSSAEKDAKMKEFQAALSSKPSVRESSHEIDPKILADAKNKSVAELANTAASADKVPKNVIVSPEKNIKDAKNAKDIGSK